MKICLRRYVCVINSTLTLIAVFVSGLGIQDFSNGIPISVAVKPTEIFTDFAVLA